MKIIEAGTSRVRTGRKRIGRIIAASVAALGSVFLALQPTSLEAATFQAYSISSATPIPGNQSFTGGLGNDFDVNSPIAITSLGAFDDLANGIAGTIDVHVFDLNNLAGPLRSVSITGSGDALKGQFRFVDIAPLILGVGNYSVVAFGFGVDDNANENVGAGIPLATNSGAGLISFVNSRFGNGDPLVAFPGTLTVGNFPCSGSPEACFGAGSFEFTPVPVPAALPLFAGGLGLLGLLGWRRRQSTKA